MHAEEFLNGSFKLFFFDFFHCEENYHTEDENIQRMHAENSLDLRLGQLFMRRNESISVQVNREIRNYAYNTYWRSPYDSPHYNDSLDMDQQNPEFWDSL